MIFSKIMMLLNKNLEKPLNLPYHFRSEISLLSNKNSLYTRKIKGRFLILRGKTLNIVLSSLHKFGCGLDFLTSSFTFVCFFFLQMS